MFPGRRVIYLSPLAPSSLPQTEIYPIPFRGVNVRAPAEKNTRRCRAPWKSWAATATDGTPHRSLPQLHGHTYAVPRSIHVALAIGGAARRASRFLRQLPPLLALASSCGLGFVAFMSRSNRLLPVPCAAAAHAC